jgi:AcrR family transcriptional regulator
VTFHTVRYGLTVTSTRDRWLDAGLDLLREEGAAALRVDRLARRVGLTKGSFHHHFAGAPDYRRTLLAHCCARADAAIAAARLDLASLADAAVTSALPSLAARLHDRAFDVALRGWAVEDADARAAVAAIDGARLAFLEELWNGVLGDREAARAAALLPHLVTVGASVTPGLGDEELAAAFSLLARLAPAPAPAADGRQPPPPAPPASSEATR